MASQFRFPRAFRIRSNARFGRIFRDGRRARGNLLLVVGAENGLGHPRLGLSVGKKVWKSAVKRNRVRRVFREAFRLSAPERPPLDLVLVPAAKKLRPNTRETQRELVRLAEKVARRLDEARRVDPDASSDGRSEERAP